MFFVVKMRTIIHKRGGKFADDSDAGVGMRGPEADEDSRREELHRAGRDGRIQREHRAEIHVRLLHQRQPARGDRVGAWDEVTKWQGAQYLPVLCVLWWAGASAFLWSWLLPARRRRLCWAGSPICLWFWP
nr:MAG TPA: hypothetical protein [Caudoviricetes sp.]